MLDAGPAPGRVRAVLSAVTVYIIVKLSRSPDSDWVVGVVTAAPVALLGVVAIVLARSVGGER